MKTQTKIIIIVVAVFFILIVRLVFIDLGGEGTASDPNFNYTIIDHPYEKIIPIGDNSTNGFYDPTVEYKNSSLGYLIYTGIEQRPENIQYQNAEFLHTHLAKSTDNGKTWTFIKRITESTSDTVESPLYAQILKLDNNTIEGEWHNEVPVLVYVPDDIGKEWKLYWHKYFSKQMPIGEQRPRILTHGWIMMKEASTPENLDNAEEIKLFSTSFSPGGEHNFEEYTGTPITPATAYSEPGAIYWNGKIYIALSYFEGDKYNKLILVSSSDHGKTWDYLGVILEDRDAEAVNKDYRSFWGVGLAEEQGRLFLLAPPIVLKGQAQIYQGTYIFEFEDIDEAKLKRDEQGKLVPYKYFKGSLLRDVNSGQADYHEYNTYGGLIMSQADLDSKPKIGQIWNTKENLV